MSRVKDKFWNFDLLQTGVWFDETDNQHKSTVKRFDISDRFAAHLAETGHLIKRDGLLS